VLQRYGGEWIVTDKEEAKFLNLGRRLIAGPPTMVSTTSRRRDLSGEIN